MEIQHFLLEWNDKFCYFYKMLLKFTKEKLKNCQITFWGSKVVSFLCIYLPFCNISWHCNSKEMSDILKQPGKIVTLLKAPLCVFVVRHGRPETVDQTIFF